jgi:3-dehydroquinate dehydratase
MAKKLAEDTMKSFEQYRRYAADYLKMAQSAANDGDKARLLQMAETWRHLAELAEAQAVAKDDDC